MELHLNINHLKVGDFSNIYLIINFTDANRPSTLAKQFGTADLKMLHAIGISIAGYALLLKATSAAVA